MSSNEPKVALNDAAKELDLAQETVRLKLHLLSMDARRAWQGLEGRFLKLKDEIEERGERTVADSAVAARDLAHSIRKFVEKNL